MATYVLVHGAWHGSWEWEHLTPFLEAEGHRVIAVDLPRTTLEANAEAVRDAVDTADEPVILLGHSAGGMFADRSRRARARPCGCSEVVDTDQRSV